MLEPKKKLLALEWQTGKHRYLLLPQARGQEHSQRLTGKVQDPITCAKKNPLAPVVPIVVKGQSRFPQLCKGELSVTLRFQKLECLASLFQLSQRPVRTLTKCVVL